MLSIPTPLSLPSRFRAAVLGLAALSVASCASIISDSDYSVTFDSNPPGAKLAITDQDGQPVQSGRAPLTATLPASAGFFDAERYTVRASLDGYSDGIATLSARLDGWYIGNILFGGLIGWLLVDPATGAMWKLPKRLQVQLEPLAP